MTPEAKSKLTAEKIRAGAKTQGVPLGQGCFVAWNGREITAICPLTAACVYETGPMSDWKILLEKAVAWAESLLGRRGVPDFWFAFDDAPQKLTPQPHNPEIAEHARMLRKELYGS